jgi:hypothetical protein
MGAVCGGAAAGLTPALEGPLASVQHDRVDRHARGQQPDHLAAHLPWGVAVGLDPRPWDGNRAIIPDLDPYCTPLIAARNVSQRRIAAPRLGRRL